MKVHLRTPEEKADVVASWARPDEEFFSAGACHILASVCVKNLGYRTLFIRPKAGQRGGHVVAASEDRIVDATGFHHRMGYLERYFEQMQELVPGWDADVIELSVDAASWEFCRSFGYRHPTEFPSDPIDRAEKFSARLIPTARAV